MQHHRWPSWDGWGTLGWIALQKEAVKPNLICSLEDMINFSLILLISGGKNYFLIFLFGQRGEEMDH